MAATAERKTYATRELTLTRVFDAPRELVFRMWTEPKHMAQWWGPKGFTNPVCELDVRPGGAIRIDLRGPDGTIYPMTGAFREIVPPQRLVFVSFAENDGQHVIESLTTVTFAEQAGKTTMTVHANAAALAPIGARFLQGMEAGWNGSLDRLAELVAQQQPQKA
jgi:uncharacterized protein YndB with AHSA1/START domain